MSDHFSRPFSYDMIKDMINGVMLLGVCVLSAFEIGKADHTGIPFEIWKADHTGIPFERKVRLG